MRYRPDLPMQTLRICPMFLQMGGKASVILRFTLTKSLKHKCVFNKSVNFYLGWMSNFIKEEHSHRFLLSLYKLFWRLFLYLSSSALLWTLTSFHDPTVTKHPNNKILPKNTVLYMAVKCSLPYAVFCQIILIKNI